MPSVRSLDHLVLTVHDIPATLSICRDVPGMEAVEFTPADGSTRHALGFGAQKINLHRAGAELSPRAVAPSPAVPITSLYLRDADGNLIEISNPA